MRGQHPLGKSHHRGGPSPSTSVCAVTLYVRKASSDGADVLLNAKTDVLDDVLLGQR